MGAWFEGREDVGREAWNRLKPVGGLAMALLFFGCWAVVAMIVMVIPYTREIFNHFEDHKVEAAILVGATFVVARSLAQVQVFWHRAHVPEGLVGVQTALFEPQGYEIVGGDDHTDSSNDSMAPSWLSRPVRTLLFRPVSGDRSITVFAYPAGSEVGDRGDAARVTLLIFGARVRLVGFAADQSGSDASPARPAAKYYERGEYLLVPDAADSAQSSF
ncbi:hypothetical protein [Bifidobacterium miconisargentati]|uniref:hypothetical protein n=1 Tax=Bifidobacterium miconisargentati TaxID=2834437 RepID=UPI001BDCC413|nr:hypothetical protein [Bifidobacterium miconisargentati]MBW3090260.1 hypothetical protein [Bifidobacterium miconisargentati]